jgi:hypothetical protein
MPLEGPGRRFSVTATKATTHGAPVVELNHPGVAAKSAQTPPMAPSVANAALAVAIGVGEEFVIMMDGVHEVATSLLPGGAAAGNALYIHPADNTLKLVGGMSSGDVKFGVIDSIDTNLGRAAVNLSLRSSF